MSTRGLGGWWESGDAPGLQTHPVCVDTKSFQVLVVQKNEAQSDSELAGLSVTTLWTAAG